MIPTFLHTTWAIFKKDLAVWWRNRLTVVVSIIPVLGLLVIQALGAVAVGRSPVALVTLDHNPKGSQMQQIFHQADVFRLKDATPQQAQKLLQTLQVVAVVTIPSDFTQRVEAHEPSPIEVTVNNLNVDFTNDIRRAVPDVITQFYRAQGSASPLKVMIHEHDLRSRDVEFFQFNVLPMIVLLLTLNGLITSGIATAREWETRTIKEMLLSPVARSAIIIGKVLAGFTATLLLGILIFSLGAALDWTRPEGTYWVTSLLVLALIALLSTGLGVALGAALQRIQPVSALSTLGAFYLFFLAGGISILAFEPTWVQNVAAYDPLTYGVHALQMAVFYSSSDLLGRDVLILSLSVLAALGLGILSMRRGIAS
ncbi:MAG: ABC transporter permease [Ktedonobacteraceae bacterium]|nr:ABC transporter permease [Ktedonobacteraceae bacterium]